MVSRAYSRRRFLTLILKRMLHLRVKWNQEMVLTYGHPKHFYLILQHYVLWERETLKTRHTHTYTLTYIDRQSSKPAESDIEKWRLVQPHFFIRIHPSWKCTSNSNKVVFPLKMKFYLIKSRVRETYLRVKRTGHIRVKPITSC